MRFPPTIVLATLALVSSALGQEAPDESLAEMEEALEQGATLFPIPDYKGDFLNRDALTGDWGGLRTSLAEDYGLQFSVDVNQFYQGVWDGGTSSSGKHNGSAYYGIKLDTAQAGLWPGGFLDIRGETYWGESVNAYTGAVLAANVNQAFNEPAGNGTYLPHVTYTQFFSEKFAIMLGKLNGALGDSNSFAHGAGDQRFMNLGFSLNPVGLATAPYAPLGAGFVYLPLNGVSYAFALLDTDGKIDEAGFDTVFNGNTTISNEVRITTKFFEQPGNQNFSFLYSTKEFNSVNQDPRTFFPPGSASLSTEDSSWAFMYNFDQFLVSDSDDPEKGWGLFGRFGLSDGDANLLHRFYSLGLGGTGLIPGREQDRFGLGYFYMELSDNRVGLVTDDSEQGVEVFYNLAVTPSFELTADLQIIDGAVRTSDTAVVGGLRGRIRF